MEGEGLTNGRIKNITHLTLQYIINMNLFRKFYTLKYAKVSKLMNSIVFLLTKVNILTIVTILIKIIVKILSYRSIRFHHQDQQCPFLYELKFNGRGRA